MDVVDYGAGHTEFSEDAEGFYGIALMMLASGWNDDIEVARRV